MQKFWSWLIQSSADPSQAALTIKGYVTGFIPLFLYFVPLFHLKVGVDQLNSLPGICYNLVVAVFTIISISMTVAGLLRKIWLTWFSPAPQQ